MKAKRSTTWGLVLERSLLLGCAFWATTQSIPALMALTADTQPVTRTLLLAALLLQLALVGLLVRGVVGELPRHTHVIGLVIGWGALCAAAPVTWIGDPGLPAITRLGVPVAGVQCLQLWAIATAPRFRTAALTIIATGPAFMALQAPDHVDVTGFENWLSPTSASLALAALVTYLRSGSAYAEELDRWNRAARVRTTAATARDRAQAIARRVIHDDVISALRALASDPRPAGTTAAVEAALAALSSHRELTRRADLLTHLADSSDIEVQVHDEGWPADPPAHVIDAFAGSAAECLRNVQRHAGTSHASVLLTVEDGVYLVEVRDEGRGFDVGAAGFGLTHSVIAPMEAVGGAARVESRPGRGTSVRLTWRPAPPPPREQVTPYAASRRATGFVRISIPMVVASGFFAFHYRGQQPAVGVTLGLLLIVLVPLSAWRFSQRPATLASSLGITLLSSGLTWVGLANVEPGGLLDFHGWVVGFAGSLTMFMAFDARVRLVVLPVVAQTGVILYFAHRDPTLALLEPVGAIVTPLTIVGFSCLFGVLLRRGAHAVRQSEATVAARLEEASWLAAQASVRSVWLETLRADVTPFLTAALASPGDDATRHEADVLAARCRDELHLDHPLPEPVRRVVDEARRRGIAVTFRAAPGEQLPGPLLTALSAVLELGAAEVVTVLPGRDARIVVLPALSVRQTRQLPDDVQVSGDDVRSIVTLSSDRSAVATARRPVPLMG